MRNILLLATLLTGTIILGACGDTSSEYTIGKCFLIFDNSTHQDATLASAMNPNAPGIFCTITKSLKGGAPYLNFTNSAGNSSSALLNALDTKRTIILGYNEGIIVGYGAIGLPPTFYAFDRECPNCFDPNDIPMRSKPLSIDNSGIATCKACQRKYDLNNDGFVTSGADGKRLTRYHATTTGPFGVLAIN